MFFINAVRFIFEEIIYLVRHPWTFNWIATLAWLLMIGIGVLAIQNNTHPAIPVILFIFSFPTYYWLKIELNRRRPGVMKRHHKHYYTASDHRKQRNSYPRKSRGKRPPGQKPYRTGKEIDDIIKKITSK